MVNDQSVINSAKEALIESFGEQAIIKGGKTVASEDFSFISNEVPSLLLNVAVGNIEDGYTYPMHHPKARFDEAQLYKGAAAYANIALHWLSQNK